MPFFTTNFCRNPSFQVGLEGYSSLLDGEIALDQTNVLYGNQSCIVNCPGNRAGEGCITAGGIIQGHATCAASCFVTGSGSITVSAVINPGGTVVVSVPVECTGQWKRVKLEGIECTPGQTLYLTCTTTSASACQFWLSGVQIEDSSPCHDYCDGDQDGCEWFEGFWGGVSVCHVSHPINSSSNILTASPLVSILAVGERFFIDADSSSSKVFDDLVELDGVGPASSLTDFSVCQLTDPDPAQTYVSWNNAGSTSPTGGTYARSWSVFVPPVDYLVSNGQVLYNRAAYAAAGWLFSSVPNSGTVNLARVQAEVLPVLTGYSAESPSNFDTPRAIHPIIKPNRLNFCTNPSIEVNTTGWSAVGSAAIARDATVSVGQIIEYDDQPRTPGVASLKVTVNANGDGAQITIPDLLTELTYIASVYVQAGPGLENILMTIGDGVTSVLATGGTGYGGPPPYDVGPYGGINPASDIATATWFRINCIFTATADSEILQVTSAAALDVAYPTHIWIDAVMVEAGELLSFYFDGNFGPNYYWETGGAVQLSRSYFYDQANVKKQAVNNILARHTPLGILSNAPQYAVPYTQ